MNGERGLEARRREAQVSNSMSEPMTEASRVIFIIRIPTRGIKPRCEAGVQRVV